MRLLKMAWSEGLEVFLYDNRLNARRADCSLTDGDKRFLKLHKIELIAEIKNLTKGQRVSFDQFLEDRRCLI